MRLIERGALLVTVMICSATAPLHAQAARTTKILFLYGHDPNAPAAVAFTQPLKAVLHEEIPTSLEIYSEYLDLDRFPGPNRLPQLARYFAEKYQGFRPDAIVAEGARALRFATERLTSLFPGVPIVYQVERVRLGRHLSRNAVRQLLTDHAEYGGWELARLRRYRDGTRDAWIRRKIIRMRP